MFKAGTLYRLSYPMVLAPVGTRTQIFPLAPRMGIEPISTPADNGPSAPADLRGKMWRRSIQLSYTDGAMAHLQLDGYRSAPGATRDLCGSVPIGAGVRTRICALVGLLGLEPRTQRLRAVYDTRFHQRPEIVDILRSLPADTGSSPAVRPTAPGSASEDWWGRVESNHIARWRPLIYSQVPYRSVTSPEAVPSYALAWVSHPPESRRPDRCEGPSASDR